MANTFTLISTTTVGAGGAASIDFTSIPQIYTDLYLVVSGRTSNTGSIWNTLKIAFNGVSTNQSQRYLYGDGSTVGTGTDAFISVPFGSTTSSATANTFATGSAYIPNYAGSTNKSVSADGVTENNGTTSGQAIAAGLWSSTAAITSITLTPNTSANFVQYSTASLYGILKGSGGATVS